MRAVDLGCKRRGGPCRRRRTRCRSSRARRTRARRPASLRTSHEGHISITRGSIAEREGEVRTIEDCAAAWLCALRVSDLREAVGDAVEATLVNVCRHNHENPHTNPEGTRATELGLCGFRRRTHGVVLADGAGAGCHDRVRSLESVLGAEDCAHAAAADVQRSDPRRYVRLHPATRGNKKISLKATSGQDH